MTITSTTSTASRRDCVSSPTADARHGWTVHRTSGAIFAGSGVMVAESSG